MSSTSLGFSAFFRERFEALGEPSLVAARVLRGEPAPVRVVFESGEASASLAGRLRDAAFAGVVAGDWVALDRRLDVVRHVLPRRTAFVRGAAGRRTRPQVVAANIDVAFVVMGLDDDFNLHRLERYLALVHASGASPVVLLTKAAAAPSLSASVTAAQATARTVPVHAIDVVAGMDGDVPGRYLTAGTSAVLLGSSGVGKSTLLNHLLGEEHARTAPTRAGDGKGRHTTTHRELFFLPSGAAIVDTPGMRELALWCDAEAIGAAFDDVMTLAERCRFRDCRHQGEPGCAVQIAIDEGRLDPDRAGSFDKLQREMEQARGRRAVWERRAKERLGGRVTREAMRQKYGRKQ